jgi:hypothetical protein
MRRQEALRVCEGNTMFSWAQIIRFSVKKTTDIQDDRIAGDFVLPVAIPDIGDTNARFS